MPTTTKIKIEAWFKGAVGRPMNPDHAFGLQCKDVADDYSQSIYGVPWPISMRPGNAGAMFTNAPDAFWMKIANDPKKPQLLPQRGDLVVYPGRPANGWFGHIAVVEAATSTGVHVVQQDGFLQKPAFRDFLPFSKHLPVGWLRPYVPAPVKPKPVAQYYVVKKGDTMSTIAEKHKLTLAKLAKLNPSIKDLNKIAIGQKVRVK